ncbi:MAG: CBS domain-containing protein [Bacteroidetes bacterium]|nr:CBS domain-containing protein [Bacteroidota bacterium]
MVELKDLLTGGEFRFVKTEMSVLDVAKYMDSHNLGAVPILGNDNTLKGIFSEKDLLKRCISKELNLKETLVSDVMTKKVIVIESHDNPEYCLRILKQEKISHIPIIEENKLIGMLSLQDILLYNIRYKEEKIEKHKTPIRYKEYN